MTEKLKELLAEGYRARKENRLSASRAIFIDVVRKAAEEGDRPSLAEALGGLAEAEDGIGNSEAARHHYANAAVLYRQIGPPKMLACTLRHEADLWVRTNRPAEAEPLYLEAEKVYRQNGEESALDLAHTLRALALIREAKGEATAARSLWQEACEIYARLEVKEALAECDKKLSALNHDPQGSA
jgi:tetratricopeptide (TPR) repeat protein